MMMKTYHHIMETTIKSVTQDDDNLDIFPLISLDSLVNTSEENFDDQRLIRSSIDHLKTFENIDKCVMKFLLNNIESRSLFIRIVLGTCLCMIALLLSLVSFEFLNTSCKGGNLLWHSTQRLLQEQIDELGLNQIDNLLSS